MVRPVAVGQGGRGRVEGEASVYRVHRAVGGEAERRGAGAPLGCAFMELWCWERRSIEGEREGIVKVGVESSLSAPTSLSPSGMVWWTTAEWVSSTRMMSTGPEASEPRVSSS